jgi:hypothetical protein
VTAFIHPAFGNAITVNAPGSTATLRGLVLNGGPVRGISVQAVGTLNVENCFITGFAGDGIQMLVPGNLNMKNTDVKGCNAGVRLANSSGTVTATIDRCHVDGNQRGSLTNTTSPGGSTTTATNTTANGNTATGRLSIGSGIEILSLEFCVASQNGANGVGGNAGSTNASSAVRYSNCVFANNVGYGVSRAEPGVFESRGKTRSRATGRARRSGPSGPSRPCEI